MWDGERFVERAQRNLKELERERKTIVSSTDRFLSGAPFSCCSPC